MKKLLALALALVMVLALCACGGGSAAEAPAEEAAPAEDAAPLEEAAPVDEAGGDASGEMGDGASGEMGGDASGEMADASGEMEDASGASEEDNGPVDAFDLIVNTPVIGEGASAVSAVGGDAQKVDVEFSWTGANGDVVTLDSGTFQEGDYTLSVTFKAADGYEMADPVNVKFVGGAGTEYAPVSSTGVDDNGAPVFEMTDCLTLTAGEATGEPAA